MDWFAVGFQKFYDYTTTIPRWLFLVITGTLGSVLLNLMHSKPKAQAPKPQGTKSSTAKAPATPTPVEATTTATASSPTKKRKSGRK